MSSAFVILAGCNMVAGAGKDIERGGEKVQDTTWDVQQQMQAAVPSITQIFPFGSAQ